MRLLLTLLIVANIALAAWYTVRKCWSRQGIEFNHVLAFTVGFLFYWICPVALGVWRFFDEMPAMSVWYGIFDGIGDAKLAAYLSVSLLAYLSFVFGTERGESRRPRTAGPGRKRILNIRLMNGYLVLVGGMFVPAAIGIRSEFFKGYTNIRGVQDLYSRSQFGAVTVFSILLWMLYSSMHHQKLNLAAATYGVFANRFLALYAVEAVLAISMGSRYIELSSAFMFATYCSVYFRRWSARTMGSFLALLLVFALAVGAVRTDLSVTKSLGEIAFEGLGETVNGALSLTYFLREYSFGVLRWPAFLLSDYVYLVPRILLPMKDSMILSPEDLGFHVENPVGGMHSFFSFMINFGALGTMLFLFAFGYGMGSLKSWRRSILPRTVYAMLSGWTLISFFRNPFEVSLVKDMFQMSIVMPAFILGSVYFFSDILRARRLSTEVPVAS
jgi:hypothetical protein